MILFHIHIELEKVIVDLNCGSGQVKFELGRVRSGIIHVLVIVDLTGLLMRDWGLAFSRFAGRIQDFFFTLSLQQIKKHKMTFQRR